LVVYLISFTCGGPLFLLSWGWLSRAVAFSHRPFLILTAHWLLVLIPPVRPDPARVSVVQLFMLAALPLGSCIAMLAIILANRARQDQYFASVSSPVQNQVPTMATCAGQ
jgi:hypothetical protein